MAITGLRSTAVLSSNRFLRALGSSLALAVVPWFALSAAQSAKSSNPLTTNPTAVPKSIRNAPFSADVSTQYDRLLANGNHIHRETIGKVYRDAQGRVRTETQIPSPAGSSSYIVIQDPVLREVVHLDPRSKTANVHHLIEPLPVPSSLPSPGPVQKGSVLLVTPQGQSGAAAVPLHPGAVKDPIVESLGTKTMQGVQVVGTRTTRMIDSGSDEPIVAVTDVWYSPDLQMVVLSISDDGQSGRSLTRVTNIVRAVPNEQLFQTPPDYTVKDGSHFAAIVKH
jgi:hypothetical protein